MKRLLCTCALALLAGAATPARAGAIDDDLRTALAGAIDDDLRTALAGAPADRTLSVLVYLAEQVDLPVLEAQFDQARAPLAVRHETVVLALQATSQASQPALLNHLAQRQAAGAVTRVTPFWIVNAVRVDALPAEIVAIAARADVGTVYLNYPIELIAPVNMPADGSLPADRGGPSAGVEPGLTAIRAPEVWAMGLTGVGRLVANLDTGVEGNHPALASRWRGLDPRYAGHGEWAFFDNIEPRRFFPFDSGSHGTHTMGSVCGGPPGEQVGVAPGAQWIAGATIDRAGIQRTIDDSIAGFQWLIDPDGDPSTNWDVPDSCSNSWGLHSGHGWAPCNETFWQYLDACEAAGIVIIFSAGNESTGGLRRPADRATDDYRTFAVAAVDSQDGAPPYPVASFSSRGPTNCTPDGRPAIKPDIAAPGVNVNSSVPPNVYAQYSGTSMASPHVNGVVALMREANPDLPVDEIKQIIYDTALDQGPGGEDNDYGWGVIDAFEAVTQALSFRTLSFNYPNGRPSLIHPNGGTAMRVVVGPSQETQPQPGTGRLHYDAGAGWQSVPMQQTTPNVYDAVFPATPCKRTVLYYVSSEGTDGQTYTNPPRAPLGAYSALSSTGLVGLTDNFENDNGWTAVNLGATDGDWQRGVPNPNTSNGPRADSDGSGKCWVTDNGNEPSDVDSGSVRLISPIIDLAVGGSLAYDYYLYMNIPENGRDHMLVEISSNGPAGPWIRLANYTASLDYEWHTQAFTEEELLALGVTFTSNMQLRFTATDGGLNTNVEAAVDAFATVGVLCPPGFEAGDLNCDGAIDLFDIEPFTLALFDPAGYAARYPNCDRMLADVNGDGNVDAFDIEPFIDLLFGP